MKMYIWIAFLALEVLSNDSPRVTTRVQPPSPLKLTKSTHTKPSNREAPHRGLSAGLERIPPPDPLDDRATITPEIEKNMEALGYLYFHPNECQILGVHLSPGSLWTNPTLSIDDKDTDVPYIVGFASPGACDESQLHLHLMVANSISVHLKASKVREYTAPKDSGVDYHRYFYFFELPMKEVRASPCAFNYTIIHKDYVTIQFNFTSRVYCQDDYKVITFGQSDDGVAGILTLDSLRYYPYDMIILTGNYVTGYHLDDGRLGDRFFSTAEHILATTVSVVLPGRRESFDSYRMFQSRFLYPGCEDKIECDMFAFRDIGVSLFFLNIDKYLTHPELDLSAYVDQVHGFLGVRHPGVEREDIWKMVFTNTHFYCSDEALYDNCISNLFLIKEFEDLFEMKGIHLVVSSSKMNYESIRNVYNFAVRQTYNEPRNYLISGVAGCHNYLADNGHPKLMKGMSFSIESTIQAVVSIDFYPNFYKMDLLDVPRFVSQDLRYMNIRFDWWGMVFFVAAALTMVGIVVLFELTDATKIGKAWAVKMLQETGEEQLEEQAEDLGLPGPVPEGQDSPTPKNQAQEIREALIEEEDSDDSDEVTQKEGETTEKFPDL